MSSDISATSTSHPHTLDEWLDYITQLHSSAIDLSLQRIKPLAESLGLTQFDCPVITVGGSNGKGSTVRILEQIYRAAGYRVAAYTSPHLLQFNERLRLDGLDINKEALLQAFERIEKHRAGQAMSFFEFTTLAILWLCQQFDPDIVLLEVGLGGRLDAVNVVESDVAIVTSVGMDHMKWLGYSREAIGAEKAGIFRADKPAICGDFSPPSSLIKTANALKANFLLLGQDFTYVITPPTWHWQGNKKAIRLLPLPRLNINNAACSLMAVEQLASQLPVRRSAVCKGLANAELAGRFERVKTPYSMVFDVAHNAESAAYLAKQLREHTHKNEKRIAIMGMLDDKPIAETIAQLKGQINTWFVSDLNCSRTADSARICDELKRQKQINVHRFPDVNSAMRQAVAQTNKNNTIVVFGSFHTVAEAKLALQKNWPPSLNEHHQ